MDARCTVLLCSKTATFWRSELISSGCPVVMMRRRHLPRPLLWPRASQQCRRSATNSTRPWSVRQSQGILPLTRTGDLPIWRNNSLKSIRQFFLQIFELQALILRQSPLLVLICSVMHRMKYGKSIPCMPSLMPHSKNGRNGLKCSGKKMPALWQFPMEILLSVSPTSSFSLAGLFVPVFSK